MASDTNNPGFPGREGKRSPVTLDLSAEEVRRGEAGAEADPGTADAVASGDEPSAGDATTPPDASWPGPEQDDALSSTRRDEISATNSDGTSLPGQPSGSHEGGSSRRSGVVPAALLSALLGGAVGAGGVILLDRTGYLDLGLTSGATTHSSQAEIAALRGEFGDLRQRLEAAEAAEPDDGRLAGMAQQVATLEQSVAELGNRPAPAGPDQAVLAGLEDRLAQLEQRPVPAAPTGGSDALAARVEEIAAQLQSLSTALPAAGNGALTARVEEIAAELQSLRETRPDDAALARRVEDLAAQVGSSAAALGELSAAQDSLTRLEHQVAELATRVDSPETGQQLAGLESGIAAVQEQIAQLSEQLAAVPKPERVAALEAGLSQAAAQASKAESLGPAIAANALAAALGSGAPFVRELDALATLGVDPGAVDALRPSAETGLPSSVQLQSEFETAAAGLDLRTPIAEDAGPVGRLFQSARGLVEVRSTGALDGADPSAVVGRIRAALGAGDLQGALVEWRALPEEAKTRTAEWARSLEARVSADALADRLRSEALSRIAAAG